MRRDLAVDGAAKRDLRQGAVRHRVAGRIFALAVALFAICGAGGAAAQQVCTSNQAQLTQAIADSQSALTRVSSTLDGFGRELIGPRTGPVDAGTVTSARSNLDAFISALSAFSAQVRQIGQSCGPQFATDAQTLANIVSQFEAERARADSLIADHQALVSSGEPPMTQAQMEGVQRALAQQGFYQGGADGRFGPGTRDGIRRFQQARGLLVTGYLTAEQLAQLTQPQTATTPPPGQTTPPPGQATPPPGQTTPPPVSGLPPAPDGTVQTPPPSTVLDPQAAAICTQNTREVNNATERTRTFRQQVATRIGDYRAAIRGPRIPAIDAEAGNRIIADVSSYLSALEAFYNQAETVVGHCDATYDGSFQTLTDQLDGLRTVSDRVIQLNEDYATLLASGEPAMSQQTMQQVQEGLQARGHYSGAIDAVYGPGTRNAIRAYQAAAGAAQTGYLTAQQISALRQPPPVPTPTLPPPAVVTPTPTPPPPPTPEIEDAIDAPTPAASLRFGDARERLAEDLGSRQPPRPLSGVRPGDGRFGDHWWRARDMLAEDRQQEAIEQRLALFGAAYLDRGAESLSMVDAHLIVGDGFARLGLYGDAAFHLQRAYDIWSGLGRDAPQEEALLLERLAAARLAQAVANGRLGSGAFDDIGELLAEALAGAGDDRSLRELVIGRTADLHVAAERAPDDPAVEQALEQRYGG